LQLSQIALNLRQENPKLFEKFKAIEQLFSAIKETDKVLKRRSAFFLE
jgi:hypothetical protein